MKMKAPVITIDGPSGTGKGTLAKKLSVLLGWHYLDSGAVYRSFSWWVKNNQVEDFDNYDISSLLPSFSLDFSFHQDQEIQISCNGEDITTAIRTEDMGLLASKLSSNSLIRKGLLDFQLSFRQMPGLVTDGRDMGTVVFPDAMYKFFLTASVEERALRRYKQLQERAISGNLRNIERDLACRDERDQTRSVSPLLPADDAIVIDTTHMSIDQVMANVTSQIQSEL